MKRTFGKIGISLLLVLSLVLSLLMMTVPVAADETTDTWIQNISVTHNSTTHRGSFSNVHYIDYYSRGSIGYSNVTATCPSDNSISLITNSYCFEGNVSVYIRKSSDMDINSPFIAVVLTSKNYWDTYTSASVTNNFSDECIYYMQQLVYPEYLVDVYGDIYYVSDYYRCQVSAFQWIEHGHPVGIDTLNYARLYQTPARCGIYDGIYIY